MPDSPAAPAPRTSRSSTVSAWSSMVWPSATRPASSSQAARSKKARRTWCPACSTETRRARAKSATAADSTTQGTPNRCASPRQKRSSSSDCGPRSRWFTWATPARVTTDRPASSPRRCSRATESPPPDTAATTRPPGGINAHASTDAATRSASDTGESREPACERSDSGSPNHGRNGAGAGT